MAQSFPDIRSRVRGLVVGYCLGDALSRTAQPQSAALVAGTPSMLFLASTEGLIRALVREQLAGPGAGLPDCLWHATARWAYRARRDTLTEVVERRGAAEPATWPDGWLSHLSLLRGGRGSAPAVEAALDLGRELDPRPGRTASDSVGDLVLARTLPVALLGAVPDVVPAAFPGDLSAGEGGGHRPAVKQGHPVSRAARDVAAYSHGLPAQVIAVAVTRTLADALTTGHVAPLVDLADLSAVYNGVPHGDEVVRARVALRRVAEMLSPHVRHVGDVPSEERLQLDPVTSGVPSGPRSTLRAATDGLRSALAFPDRSQVTRAIEDVLHAPQPAAAAITVALLGAAHGFEALPEDAVSRLDVGHVADQLALDFLAQATLGPLSAPDDAAAKDWIQRYPPS